MKIHELPTNTPGEFEMFMHTLYGSFAFVLITVLLGAESYGNDNTRPNIVFMIADDLGWADVEFHGGNVPSPNLNQLLGDGMELSQHYVAPVCSPTRA